MIKKSKNNGKFYGAATLGEKGQVVIPSEAREIMDLNKGDKLLAFGFGDDMLVLSKLSNLEKFASHLSKKVNKINEIIKKNK